MTETATQADSHESDEFVAWGYDANRDCLDLKESYFDFDEIDRYIDWASEKLEDVDFDTMVGRGLSGALIVPKLAEALGKHWAIVRKPRDSSHSSEKIVGRLGRRWLFVDDFICSGDTKQACIDAVCEVVDDATTKDVGWTDEEIVRGTFDVTFVGAYEYRGVVGDDPKFIKARGY